MLSAEQISMWWIMLYFCCHLSAGQQFIGLIALSALCTTAPRCSVSYNFRSLFQHLTSFYFSIRVLLSFLLMKSISLQKMPFFPLSMNYNCHSQKIELNVNHLFSSTQHCNFSICYNLLPIKVFDLLVKCFIFDVQYNLS